MSKDDTKKAKVTHEQPKKGLTKPKGRSFCCSMFIYTFVFVSGVVAATVLPDLAGHHLKQPYAKEYGAMAEQLMKDLPKHLKSLSETAMVLGHELVDRVWEVKAMVEQKIADMNTNQPDTTQTKTTKEHSTTRTKDHVHTTGDHDKKPKPHTSNDRPSATTSDL